MELAKHFMISAKDRVSLLTIVWAQRELTRQVSLAVATGADLSFGLEILTLHVTMLHGGVLGPKELTKLLYHGSWLYKETKKQITHHHDHKKARYRMRLANSTRQTVPASQNIFIKDIHCQIFSFTKS